MDGDGRRQRYHARRIKTALEVRQVVQYILNNARRHAVQRGVRHADDWLDPCSSAPHFDGWYGRAPPLLRDYATVAPRSERLDTAWRAYGFAGRLVNESAQRLALMFAEKSMGSATATAPRNAEYGSMPKSE